LAKPSRPEPVGLGSPAGTTRFTTVQGRKLRRPSSISYYRSPRVTSTGRSPARKWLL